MIDPIFEHTIEDKLYRTKYEPDSDHPHISVNQEICKGCADKDCTIHCPAVVYKLDPGDRSKITVSHDNCLECGTCILVCPHRSVDWQFPDGGVGVKYRYG
jgi:ferredoxin like protein